MKLNNDNDTINFFIVCERSVSWVDILDGELCGELVWYINYESLDK